MPNAKGIPKIKNAADTDAKVNKNAKSKPSTSVRKRTAKAIKIAKTAERKGKPQV